MGSAGGEFGPFWAIDDATGYLDEVQSASSLPTKVESICMAGGELSASTPAYGSDHHAKYFSYSMEYLLTSMGRLCQHLT